MLDMDVPVVVHQCRTACGSAVIATVDMPIRSSTSSIWIFRTLRAAHDPARSPSAFGASHSCRVPPRIGACLLIRAGDFPRLGAPEEGLPEPYVFVNRVLRMLRNPLPDALHSHIPGVLSADVKNTRAWEARFDLPDAPLIPLPPKVMPAAGN
ncbi:DUF3396 domain-containing protein [Paraburkholderia strydomiana]|nr:DUF3396 domain-containing protein [Paraburkholderia strydomiana]